MDDGCFSIAHCPSPGLSVLQGRNAFSALSCTLCSSLKAITSIVLGTKRELQNRKSLGFPGANCTLSSSKMAPGAKDIMGSYMRLGGYIPPPPRSSGLNLRDSFFLIPTHFFPKHLMPITCNSVVQIRDVRKMCFHQWLPWLLWSYCSMMQCDDSWWQAEYHFIMWLFQCQTSQCYYCPLKNEMHVDIHQIGYYSISYFFLFDWTVWWHMFRAGFISSKRLIPYFSYSQHISI